MRTDCRQSLTSNRMPNTWLIASYKTSVQIWLQYVCKNAVFLMPQGVSDVASLYREYVWRNLNTESRKPHRDVWMLLFLILFSLVLLLFCFIPSAISQWFYGFSTKTMWYFTTPVFVFIVFRLLRRLKPSTELMI